MNSNDNNPPSGAGGMKNIVTPLNEKAAAYAGTNPDEGYAQFEALKLIGLQPQHKVLEIGCGALNAGIPVIDFINQGNYTGIEPNKWLVTDSLFIKQNENLDAEKTPIFLFNQSFDATETGMKYDYIFSHSIISHAAFWQLELFLRNCAGVLAPGGQLLFDLHFVGGEPGMEAETMDDQWHYPGSVWVKKERFEELAHRFFNSIEYRPDITKMIMAATPSAVHKWVLMQNV